MLKDTASPLQLSDGEWRLGKPLLIVNIAPDPRQDRFYIVMYVSSRVTITLCECDVLRYDIA